MRVVSLLASATEIVCALDAGDFLVGRSHECDNPSWVTRLPACSEPAFDVSVSSAEIDREVKRRIRAGEPLYRIHSDLILELRPDVVIAQEHCDVCAVTPADVERGGCAIPAVHGLALAEGSLNGVFEGMRQVARLVGLEERGSLLVQKERQRLDAVCARTRMKPRPAVVALEWTAPLFSMGNWGPELIEIAGGQPLIGGAGEYSAGIEFERLKAADPDILIVAPCGFNLDRALAERSVLADYPGWKDLRAVRAGRVAFADGNRFFNRSGMTVSQTAEILAEMLHGEVFGAPAEGVHWCWTA
jgi:iron complex transport system substrate-binding protein